MPADSLTTSDANTADTLTPTDVTPDTVSTTDANTPDTLTTTDA